MTGTKFECGIAHCGGCAVLLDGDAIRSCVTPVARAANRRITTIEGRSKDASHPVRKARMEEVVVQCGCCQPGQRLFAVVLLPGNRNASDEDIDRAVSGNICRCGTYFRIRSAVRRAAAEV